MFLICYNFHGVRRLLLSLLLLVISITGLEARSAAAATTNPFTTVRELKLDNGLTLFHAQLPQARFFKFTVYVWAGSVDETAGSATVASTEGAAHFVEHLLFQNKQLSEAEFDKAIDAMGGTHNAFTHRPFTRYFVYLPKQYLQRGSGMLWNVVFNQTLLENRAPDVLSVIDRENNWADPTWVDYVKAGFEPPAYLDPPGFWERQFALPDFDRPVGGTAGAARHVSFNAAKEFHDRFYTVPNMTAIYVGPHPAAEVAAQLNKLVRLNPGKTEGTMNVRPSCTPPAMPLKPFRRLEFDDQQPDVTLGYLLSGLNFDDSPMITLYSETVNRHLYQSIRQQYAETYSTDRFVESYRDCGYIAFRTQASRLRYDSTAAFMNQQIFSPFESIINEEEFERTKQNYLSYVTGRLENPEFLEAYLSLLIREHPTHQPSRKQLDWVGSVKAVDYDTLGTWTKQRLDPKQRYEHLNAPSVFIPYEVLPLFLLAGIITFFLWRRVLLRPGNLRGVFMSSSLAFLPFGPILMVLLYYPTYLAGLHLLHLARLALDAGVDRGMPLYLSAYMHVLLPPVVFGTLFILAAALQPRRLLITGDRFTVRCLGFYSWSVRFNEIKSIKPIGRRELWNELRRGRLLPLHLFFGKGVVLERTNGKSLAFRLQHPGNFLETLRLALTGTVPEKQQLLLPGIAPWRDSD